MKRYVICIAETQSGEIVVIKKNRPEWQKGLYNFPGGKIEETDNCTRDAAIREFYEETGVKYEDWIYRGYIYREDDFVLYVYFALDNVFLNVETKTDEEVEIVNNYDCEFSPDEYVDNFKQILDLYGFLSPYKTVYLEYKEK